MTGSLGRIWLATASLCLGTWLGAALEVGPIPPIAILMGAIGVLSRRRPWLSLMGIVLLSVGTGALNAELRLPVTTPLDVLARDVPRCDIHGSVLEPAGGLGTIVMVDGARCATWSASSLGPVAVREGAGPPGSAYRAEGWFVPLGHDGFDASLRRAGA